MSLADSLKSLNEFDINDLDVNNAGIWPAPIKFIVVLIIFGLIAGGGYWFFIKDQYAQLERVERTEQELRKTYEEKAYQVANLEVFKAQMAEMEETFGALVRQLPSETEVPGLLRTLRIRRWVTAWHFRKWLFSRSGSGTSTPSCQSTSGCLALIMSWHLSSAVLRAFPGL